MRVGQGMLEMAQYGLEHVRSVTHPQAVEGAVGDRLRLDEYRHQFADEDSAQRLTEVLAENQPPVRVSGLAFRQWH